MGHITPVSDEYFTIRDIDISGLYALASTIVHSYSYSMDRMKKEIDGKRREEIWVHKSYQNSKAMVWIEYVPREEKIEKYLTADVLRAMNEENISVLFFFTNAELSDSDQYILEGKEHYIFSIKELSEYLSSVNNNKNLNFKRKRKSRETLSGISSIKNFLRYIDISKLKEEPVKFSQIKDIIKYYKSLVEKILVQIDNIKDIYDITSDQQKDLKEAENILLQELLKVGILRFPQKFSSLTNLIFKLIKVTIIYVNNYINYESEEDLKNSRVTLENLMEEIAKTEYSMNIFKVKIESKLEQSAVKLIMASGAVTIISLFILATVRYGG